MIEFTEATRAVQQYADKKRFWIAPEFVSGVMERSDNTTTIVTSDGELWHVKGKAEGIAKLIECAKKEG